MKRNINRMVVKVKRENATKREDQYCSVPSPTGAAAMRLIFSWIILCACAAATSSMAGGLICRASPPSEWSDKYTMQSDSSFNSKTISIFVRD